MAFGKYGAPQKYGTSITYGAPVPPWDYHILLRRPANEKVVQILKDDVTAMSFSYERYGGCAAAQITLKRDLNSYGLIGPWYLLEIYTTDRNQQSRSVRWTGFVEPLISKLGEQTVSINARGLRDWLGNIVVPQQTYEFYSDVSGIVTDIVDTFVVPGSKIQHTAELGLIQNVNIPVENLSLNTTVLQALTHLSLIGGNAEWGVRADREFYFLPRIESAQHYFAESSQPLSNTGIRALVDLELQVTRARQINWLYLQAGDGEQYLVQAGAYASGAQTEAIEIAPSVMSEADALLWGASYLARTNGVQIPIEEKFSGLVADDLNLLTPAMDYVQATITVIYPAGYTKDADDTTPSVAAHYSHQSDGRVMVKTAAGDTYLILQYDVRTGGHTARAILAGVTGSFHDNLPLSSAVISTDKWRNYMLPVQRINYILTNDDLRAELDFGEAIPGLGRLHEAINFKLEELSQTV